MFPFPSNTSGTLHNPKIPHSIQHIGQQDNTILNSSLYAHLTHSPRLFRQETLNVIFTMYTIFIEFYLGFQESYQTLTLKVYQRETFKEWMNSSQGIIILLFINPCTYNFTIKSAISSF